MVAVALTPNEWTDAEIALLHFGGDGNPSKVSRAAASSRLLFTPRGPAAYQALASIVWAPLSDGAMELRGELYRVASERQNAAFRARIRAKKCVIISYSNSELLA